MVQRFERKAQTKLQTLALTAKVAAVGCDGCAPVQERICTLIACEDPNDMLVDGAARGHPGHQPRVPRQHCGPDHVRPLGRGGCRLRQDQRLRIPGEGKLGRHRASSQVGRDPVALPVGRRIGRTGRYGSATLSDPHSRRWPRQRPKETLSGTNRLRPDFILPARAFRRGEATPAPPPPPAAPRGQ
jgi:hypothetical protein